MAPGVIYIAKAALVDAVVLLAWKHITISDSVVIALIAAVPPTLAVLLSHVKANKKLDGIHVLVNSRLSTALEELAVLKQSILEKEGK
jgi:hypothetical protein